MNQNSPPALRTVADPLGNDDAYFSINQTHYRYNGDPVSEIGHL